MTHFTPVSAAAGGLLIGLSAAMLWVGLGRIAGISGIVGSLITPGGEDRSWRVAFLAGLIAAPLLYGLAGGRLPEIALPDSPALLIAGGLLVGFGTRLGGGCTSGHGICGLARLSLRSIAATLLFIASAGGMLGMSLVSRLAQHRGILSRIFAIVVLAVAIYMLVRSALQLGWI